MDGPSKGPARFYVFAPFEVSTEGTGIECQPFDVMKPLPHSDIPMGALGFPTLALPRLYTHAEFMCAKQLNPALSRFLRFEYAFMDLLEAEATYRMTTKKTGTVEGKPAELLQLYLRTCVLPMHVVQLAETPLLTGPA